MQNFGNSTSLLLEMLLRLADDVADQTLDGDAKERVRGLIKAALENGSIGGMTKSPEDNWSEATWKIWIKQRLMFLGFFAPTGKSEEDDYRVGTFHIFSLSHHESDEELARLPEGIGRAKNLLARSKVGKTVEIITPIDKLAARVAPTDGLENIQS